MKNHPPPRPQKNRKKKKPISILRVILLYIHTNHIPPLHENPQILVKHDIFSPRVMKHMLAYTNTLASAVYLKEFTRGSSFLQYSFRELFSKGVRCTEGHRGHKVRTKQGTLCMGLEVKHSFRKPSCWRSAHQHGTCYSP